MTDMKIHNNTVFAFEINRFNVNIKRWKKDDALSIPEACDSIMLDKNLVIYEDDLDREFFEMICNDWFKDNKERFEIK